MIAGSAKQTSPRTPLFLESGMEGVLIAALGVTAVRRRVLIVLLAPFVAGCFATAQAPLSRRTDLAKANGVTTRSGYRIDFAVDGATIANDTLRAVGQAGTIAIPTDSIAQISERRFSTRNTVGLAAGVGAAGFVVLALLSVGKLAMIP
jgi:hypothetical protein